MRVSFFEQDVSTLEPLSLTRAVFDLRCGLGTLGEKSRRVFQASQWSAWVRPMLIDVVREAHPGIAINDPNSNAKVWINAAWIPQVGTKPPRKPGVGTVGDEIAWIVLDRPANRPEEALDRVASLPKQKVSGMILKHPWDLVDANPAEITRDFHETSFSWPRPTSLHVVGPIEQIAIHPSVRIDPLVVFDATPGPIVIHANAVIAAFSRIEGPCVIGEGTHVMGAKIRGGVAIGPHCRIGGEVEASIIQGYSNKYHEGFLGHSYLGEWVNLGAGTHNSDLRNDYGDVEVTIAERRTKTGKNKVGCYIGDHTKTGLGSLLNTGSNIGVFCNVLPAGRFAPKHMPAFTTWWNGQLRLGFPMTQLLITARKAMGRRGQELTDAHVRLYEHHWELSDPHRCRALLEAEQKLFRRAA